MRTIFFSIAAGAAMLVACNQVNINEGQVKDSEVGKYDLTVKFDNQALTRIAYDAADNVISNAQILVYDDLGHLESSAQVTVSPSATSTTAKLSVSSGEKEIYVVANASQDYLQTQSADELLQSATSLSDNTINGDFIMVGSESAIVPAVTEVHINLSRIAAKIELLDISVNFGPALAGKVLTIDRVYVQNAAVNSTLSGSKTLVETDFVNQRKFVSSDFDSYLNTAYSENNTIADQATSDNFKAKYYVYPNNTETDSRTLAPEPFTPRYTRLVVEATLNNVKTYYPITIPNIEANKYYRVSALTVTGYGVDDPEKEVSRNDLNLTIEVTDWIEGSSITETI
ncbi:MAG: hypothetical protein HUJ90_03790 [Bacteroidales bacterium]|nr:hypothetical protein [Bacteroidales bacterium]